MIKVFLLEICPYVYYDLPLIRGKRHLVRDTVAEKDVDITKQMALDALIRRYKKTEMDENSNFQQLLINATKRATSSKRQNQLAYSLF